ncbi:hypothetical protein K3Z84_00750 [Pseudomonas aeruginosa]|nr:hypothetical protein [Pseudomonas aeruginosa]
MKKQILSIMTLALIAGIAQAEYRVIIPLEINSNAGVGNVGNGSLPSGSIQFISEVSEPEEPVDENANWDVVLTKKASLCINEGRQTDVYFSADKNNTGSSTMPANNNCGFTPAPNSKLLIYSYQGSLHYDLISSGNFKNIAPSFTAEVDGVEGTCTASKSAWADFLIANSQTRTITSYTLNYNCTQTFGASPQTLKIKL